MTRQRIYELREALRAYVQKEHTEMFLNDAVIWQYYDTVSFKPGQGIPNRIPFLQFPCSETKSYALTNMELPGQLSAPNTMAVDNIEICVPARCDALDVESVLENSVITFMKDERIMLCKSWAWVSFTSGTWQHGPGLFNRWKFELPIPIVLQSRQKFKIELECADSVILQSERCHGGCGLEIKIAIEGLMTRSFS